MWWGWDFQPPPPGLRYAGVTEEECREMIQKRLQSTIVSLNFFILTIYELIHAYDDCRAANLNWPTCAHQACSGIRANHLSVDCHLIRELLRGYKKFRGHEPDCVRRRATSSVRSNCSGVLTKLAMAGVWDTCYNDTKPFDRAL